MVATATMTAIVVLLLCYNPHPTASTVSSRPRPAQAQAQALAAVISSSGVMDGQHRISRPLNLREEALKASTALAEMAPHVDCPRSRKLASSPQQARIESCTLDKIQPPCHAQWRRCSKGNVVTSRRVVRAPVDQRRGLPESQKVWQGSGPLSNTAFFAGPPIHPSFQAVCPQFAMF